MAQVRLESGATIETVSPAELRQILASFQAGLDKRGPSSQFPSASILLDASGNAFGEPTGTNPGRLDVYTVPQGHSFALHRIIIDADGITPAAPFQNNAGYIDLIQRGRRVDFVNLSVAAGGLPASKTWGTADSPRWVNGDRLRLEVHGGPPSTALKVYCQGTLQPLILQ